MLEINRKRQRVGQLDYDILLATYVEIIDWSCRRINVWDPTTRAKVLQAQMQRYLGAIPDIQRCA